MFFTKKTPVHMIDPKSDLMYIDNTFIAVSLPNGKVLVLHGNFANITDAEATSKVQTALVNLQTA